MWKILINAHLYGYIYISHIYKCLLSMFQILMKGQLLKCQVNESDICMEAEWDCDIKKNYSTNYMDEIPKYGLILGGR